MEDAVLVEAAPGTHYGILVGGEAKLEVRYDMDFRKWAILDPEAEEILSYHWHRWEAIGQAFDLIVMGL